MFTAMVGPQSSDNKLPESCLSHRRDFSHLEFMQVTRYVRRGSRGSALPVVYPPEGLSFMSSKTATWIIAAGALMMFIGLCFLPGAFSGHPDTDMLEIGACQFSLGALVVAGGIYAKARILQFAIASGEPRKDSGTANQRVRGGCDLCGSEAPVVQCRVHQLHLCGGCLAQHYDVRSCAYVPTTRTASKNGRKLAASARGA
jgi:hypothetical protein